jgi:hypothetical protein
MNLKDQDAEFIQKVATDSDLFNFLKNWINPDYTLEICIGQDNKTVARCFYIKY